MSSIILNTFVGTQFNPYWYIEDKKFIDTKYTITRRNNTEFIGISFNYYDSIDLYRYRDEIELFSLYNEQFNRENLRKNIEKYTKEIVTEKFNNNEAFFRLYYLNNSNKITEYYDQYMQITNSKICSLISDNFYQILTNSILY